jgi:hypothetical protein
MKKRILLFFTIILVGSTNSFAQIEPTIADKKVPNDVGLRPPAKGNKADTIHTINTANSRTEMQITSYVNGEEVCGDVRVSGQGRPGNLVTVDIYAYRSTNSNVSGLWPIYRDRVDASVSAVKIAQEISEISGREVKGEFFKKFKVITDENGNWSIPVFNYDNNKKWNNKNSKVFAWTITARANDTNTRKGNITWIKIGCGQ